MTIPEEEEKWPVSRFLVVAALIEKDGKVLLTQRSPNKHLGMTWEFPGGKVEYGETDEEALKRELQEELGIEIDVGSRAFETCHGYGSREVHLLIYKAKLIAGVPEAIDVNSLQWAYPKELLSKSFPPADLVFVQEIAAGRIALNDNSAKDEDEDEEIAFKPAKIISKPPK